MPRVNAEFAWIKREKARREKAKKSKSRTN
jgi:hypothetical protein